MIARFFEYFKRSVRYFTLLDSFLKVFERGKSRNKRLCTRAWNLISYVHCTLHVRNTHSHISLFKYPSISLRYMRGARNIHRHNIRTHGSVTRLPSCSFIRHSFIHMQRERAYVQPRARLRATETATRYHMLLTIGICTGMRPLSCKEGTAKRLIELYSLVSPGVSRFRWLHYAE